VLKHSLEYPGHIISVGGVATDPAKIEAVQRWPVPDNVKQLRGFLGLAGYYHKFIGWFSIVYRPLMNLFNKNAQFMWTPTVENSFVAIKRTLVQAPVLALPNFTKNCPWNWCVHNGSGGCPDAPRTSVHISQKGAWGLRIKHSPYMIRNASPSSWRSRNRKPTFSTVHSQSALTSEVWYNWASTIW
jgi:hypothetical protein